MKMMKRISVVFIILLLVFLGAFLWMANTAKNKLSSMVYEDIDMNLVANGTYYGEADAALVFAKVEVTVKDHVIDNIEIIEHRNGMGSKAESIIETMIMENNYDVDAISGATLSSETIKSAVSKALKEGYME